MYKATHRGHAAVPARNTYGANRIPTRTNTTDRVLRVLLNPNDRLAKNEPLCLVLIAILIIVVSVL